MAWYWPFGIKNDLNEARDIVQNSGEISDYPLSESQIKILEHYVPGFDSSNPNSYKLVESALHSFSQLQSVSDQLKSNRQYNMNEYWVAAAYGSIYTKVSQTRQKIIREVEKAQNFYLVDVIVDQVTSDALTPDVVTGDIITMYSQNKELDKELKDLESRLKLDTLLETVVPDMLLYGDYILSTEVNEKEGLVTLRDNVDQAKVVPLSTLYDIDGYLIQEEGKLVIKQPAEYVLFSMSGRRKRIDLRAELGEYTDKRFIDNKILQDLPRFIRMGKSLIYPVMEKIKELELLEKLVPATKLSKLSSGTLVGVQVPTGYEPEKAFQAARRIESLINKKVGVNTQTGEMSLTDILAAAGRIKIVPTFGGEKGSLERFDYRSDEPDDLLSSVKDVRSTIFSSTGIPSEIIFGSEGESKSELLKRYARYLRILKRIQKSVVVALKQIAYIHLSNKGIPFREEDIQVDFRNKLIEIDNIDKLEFMDTTVSFLGNVKNFVVEMAQDTATAPRINIDELMVFLEEQLKTIGLAKVILPKGQEKSDAEVKELTGEDDEQ